MKTRMFRDIKNGGIKDYTQIIDDADINCDHNGIPSSSFNVSSFHDLHNSLHL